METEKPESAGSDGEIEALLNAEVPEPQNPTVVVRKPKKKKYTSILVGRKEYLIIQALSTRDTYCLMIL